MNSIIDKLKISQILCILLFSLRSVDGLDVVIPAVSKDAGTLDLAIRCLRTALPDVEKIYVVSPNSLTESATWVPETQFPFNLADVKRELHPKNNHQQKIASNRCGWYLQQLIKLYAWKVIPNLSEDYLVIDADTLCFRDLHLYENGTPTYGAGAEYNKWYFNHMARLLPGLGKLQEASGIVHYMLFQKKVLLSLFKQVEDFWEKPFWVSFLNCVDGNEIHSGASEYEIYFNYLSFKGYEKNIIHLKWKNSSYLKQWQQDQQDGWDYVSYHSYMRRP